MTQPVTGAAEPPIIPAPEQDAAGPGRTRLPGFWIPAIGPALVVLTVVLFAVLNPGTFLTRSNLVDNVLLSGAPLLIIACGQCIVMVAGEFDLSVGASAALAMVVSAKLVVGLSPASTTVAVVVGIGVGVATGAVNGLLIAYAGVNSFVATLGTLTLFNGLALRRTNAQPVYELAGSFVRLGQGNLLGVGNPVWLAFLCVLLTWFMLRYTPLGRRFHAVGGNAEAARYAGIEVRRTRFLAFLLAGGFSGVAGVITAAYLETADPTGPLNLMLPSIATVFLGAALLQSGRPTALGTLLGFFFWTVIVSGLNQLGINTYLQTAVQGAVLLIAVLPSALARLREG